MINNYPYLKSPTDILNFNLIFNKNDKYVRHILLSIIFMFYSTVLPNLTELG